MERTEIYREMLADQLKTAAQTLIDNADEIVGKYEFTGDIDISIYLKTDKISGPPEISINKTYYPDFKKFGEIMDKYTNRIGELRKKGSRSIKKLIGGVDNSVAGDRTNIGIRIKNSGDSVDFITKNDEKTE